MIAGRLEAGTQSLKRGGNAQEDPVVRMWTLALGLTLSMVAAAPAQAQNKPDPPPPVPQPHELGPDLARFRAAYQRAESPNIVVLVERSTGRKDAVGEGSLVSLFDATGDTYLLRVSVEEWLRKVPEVELVNVGALTAADRRDVELLALSDEREAIKLLSKKVSADLMVLVRMQPTGAHGAAYRCTVETIDILRGRTLDAFGFDWLENTDAATVKAYAQSVTRKFVDGFDRAYGVNTTAGTARRFTLKLIGVDTEQTMAAKRAFEGIPGMAEVKVGQRQASSRAGREESVTEMRLSFVGAAFDLTYELQKAAKSALGMDIRDTDMTAGAITLIAREARKPDEGPRGERWEILMDNGKDGDRARENLLSLYREKGSPRIALLINRALTEEELRDPRVAEELKQGGGQPVISSPGGPVYINIVGDVISRGGATIKPSGDGKTNEPATDQLDTQTVENEMFRRFNTKYGFTLIDPGTARASIKRETEKARRVYEENELVYLLKQQAIAEVVILGIGRIERYDGKNTPVYTFRAVRLSDAVVLSSANVAVDQYDFFNSAQAMRDAIEYVTNEATAKLADGLWIKWAPPTPLKVTVQNAKSERDLLRIRDALKDNVPALRRIEFRQFDAGREGGVGQFDAEYVCSYDELTRSFIEAQAKLPFELDKSASTQETLTIRIRDSQ